MMGISFDGIRKQLCVAYDDLAKKLNEAVDSPPYEDDEMRVFASDIQEEMDRLRELIMTMACIYDDKVEDDSNVIVDEVGNIAWFNPGEDEG